MGKTRRSRPSDPTIRYAQHKRKKTSPRLLEQGVTVDMGCSSEEQKTRLSVRRCKRRARVATDGWLRQQS